MASGIAKERTASDRILAELTHLSVRELDKVLQGAVALRLEKQKMPGPKRESELLRIINKRLDEQKSSTLDSLCAKSWEGTLTELERAKFCGSPLNWKTSRESGKKH